MKTMWTRVSGQPKPLRLCHVFKSLPLRSLRLCGAIPFTCNAETQRSQREQQYANRDLDLWRNLGGFWRDETGFVISTELIFVATIVVIGMVTGLTTVRDQVSLELADVADAVSELDQSFSYAAVTATVGSVAGSSFNDQPDFCEQVGAGADQNGAAGTQCLVINGIVGTGEQ